MSNPVSSDLSCVSSAPMSPTASSLVAQEATSAPLSVAVALPVVNKEPALETPKLIEQQVTVTEAIAPVASATTEKVESVAKQTVKEEQKGSTLESLADKVNSSSGIAVQETLKVSCEASKAAEAPAPVLSKEQKLEKYVNGKKSSIKAAFDNWKKDFKPVPAEVLYKGAHVVDSVVNAVTGLFGAAPIKTKEAVFKEAEAMSATMIATFEKGLAEATTIADLKKVLAMNIKSLQSKLSFVDEATATKMKEAVEIANAQLKLLEPKKAPAV